MSLLISSLGPRQVSIITLPSIVLSFYSFRSSDFNKKCSVLHTLDFHGNVDKLHKLEESTLPTRAELGSPHFQAEANQLFIILPDQNC